jgi:two-component system, cell cycle sensor histidine kinase and response regulator CckA
VINARLLVEIKKNRGVPWKENVHLGTDLHWLVDVSCDMCSASRSGSAQDNDMLDRKHAQEALSASEARYRRLFEAAQDGILILDAMTGEITDVNPYLISLLDYTREDFLGKKLWEIGPFRDIQASKDAFRELQIKEYVRYEDLPLETKAGRAINVEFVSNVYGVNGTRVIQCNIRNITERRRAEQAEQQLRQAQKMEAVGQLAGGIAHDFNNLLGVILGYCEVLEEQFDSADPKRKKIEQIHNAGNLAAALTRQLLAFSRRQVLQPVVLDLNVTVSNMDQMLRRLIGDDIEVVSVLRPGLGGVKADPTQIEQVLMNLACNARQAMPRGGKITIETANVDVDEAYARQHPATKPGPHVMLAVSDTGVGMNKETQAHIFEPFFTTKEIDVATSDGAQEGQCKPSSEGTGLGLATVYGIVKQSGGNIWVYSEPGHGTTFKIYLPRVEAATEFSKQEKPTSLPRGSETILLVEDATPLRQLTREVLEGSGYTVLDTGDPLEAIGIAERYKGPMPLLLTDVVMPGISGSMLAQRLTASRPEMKVLFTSGYADDAMVNGGVLKPGCILLEKPFTRDALVRKVRELLDSPGPLSR